MGTWIMGDVEVEKNHEMRHRERRNRKRAINSKMFKTLISELK